MASFFRRYKALILLMGVAFLLIPKTGVMEAGDNTAQYVGEAMRILSGRPIAFEIMRGPGFPGVLALFFSLFGTSIYSAFLAIRLSNFFCVLLTYLLTDRLFGKRAAIMCGVLVLSSFAINAVTVWMTPDLPLACFLLLTFWAISRDPDSKPYWSAFIGGVALGIACLIKEHALLFLPLPFVAFYFYRIGKKDFFTSLLVFYAAWVVVFGAWVYYFVQVRNMPWGGLLGFASPETYPHTVGKAFQEEGRSNIFTFLAQMLVKKAGYGITEYYRYALSPTFVAAPLFVASWFYCLYRAIKDVSCLYLVSIALLFSPILVATGMHHGGIRQGALFYYLTYISFTVAALALWEKLVPVLKRKCYRFMSRYTQEQAAAYFISLLVIIQLIGLPSKSTGSLLIRGDYVDGMKIFPAGIPITHDFEVAGAHRNDVKVMANWVKANVTPGQTALFLSRHPQGFRMFLGFDFFNERPQPHRCNHIEGCGAYPAGSKIYPVLIVPYPKFRNELQRFRSITFYAADELISRIVESRYVMVNRFSLDEEFMKRIGLKLINASETLALYEVPADSSHASKKAMEALKADPIVHEDMRDELLWLRESYQEEFQFFQKEFSARGVSLAKVVHLDEPYHEASRLLNRPIEEIQKMGYDEAQKQWVIDHIPAGSQVAFSDYTGVFFVPDRYKTIAFNTDAPLSSFAGNDYLLIHYVRRKTNEFPVLFEDLKNLKPMAVFPTVYGLGRGWEIYKLPPKEN